MSTVKHHFVSAVADSSDASLVRPTNWNANHDVTFTVHSITGADTILITDDVVRLGAGTYAVTVPLAQGTGKQIYVLQDGAGTITLTPSGSDTIGGASSFAMNTLGQACVLVDEAAGTWGLLGGGTGGGTPAQLAGMIWPHGWPIDSAGARKVTLSYDATTRKVTITAASGGSFDVWWRGAKTTVTSPFVSTAHTATEGNWFFYWDGTNFTWSQTTWNLYSVAPTAYVYWSSVLGSGAAYGELHEWNSDPGLHRDIHLAIGTNLQAGGALSGFTLNTFTDAALQVAIAQTTIADEDIQYVLAAMAAGSYTVWSRSGASGFWRWSTGLSFPFTFSTYAQINTFSGGNWGLVDIDGSSGGNYGTAYVVATPALLAAQQFIIIPGQTQYGSLATAQAETFASLNLGAVPFQEFVPIAQIVFFAQHGSGGTTNTSIALVTALSGSRAASVSIPVNTTTLALSYANGSSAANQTMSLLDSKGGGIVVDGSSVSFTGAAAFQINGSSTHTSGLRSALSLASTFAPTSGTGTFHSLDVAYTINQTGGANGTVTGIFLNATETAVVGSHNLLDLQVGSTSRFSVSRFGALTIAAPATAVLPGPLLSISYGNTGNLTASAERPAIQFSPGTKTWTAGSINSQREILLAPPTYAFTSASTLTTASLLALTGLPTPGTNATITNAIGLFVVGGTLAPTGGVRVLMGNQDNANTTFQPASGSASFYGLCLAYSFDPTNTSGTIAGLRIDAKNLGSDGTLATSYLVQVIGTGTNRFLIRDYGAVTINQGPLNALSAFPALDVTVGNHIALPAATEFIGARFIGGTKTWPATTVSTQREVVFFAPTYGCTSVSGAQFVDSATVAISGAPAAGSNGGLQHTAALWVQGGGTVLNGAVAINSGIAPIGSPTNPPTSVFLLGGTSSNGNAAWNAFNLNLGTYTYTGSTTTTGSVNAFIVQGGALASTNAWTVTDYFAAHIGAGVLSSGNVTVTRNWSLAIDGNITLSGAQRWHTTQVASTPYTVLTPAGSTQGDHIIISTMSSSGASTINLPSIATVGDGYILVILDGGYAAATAGRNITLARNGSDKINNAAANLTMATNGQAVRLVSDTNTNNWHIW